MNDRQLNHQVYTGGSILIKDAGNFFTTDNVEAALQQLGAGGSSSGYQIPTSGNINGSNQTFVWTIAPKVIVVDGGRAMQKVSSDGTVNWTGTTTTILTLAPNFDIFATA